MKKVSVIIAAYNCQEYIESCIDSILNQSYTDIEIIICDDHSTDDTWEILQKYFNIKRIRLLRNDKNMFSAYTRNKCLDIAKGDYIVIQDADDYSEFDRIERLVEFLENNNEYGFVGSGLNMFDDNGIWSTGVKPERPIKSDFLFAMPFAHATIMFRKEVIDSINGYRVSKETRRVEDYDMIMRIYATGCIGYNLRSPLYNYRVDKKTLQRRKFRYRVDEMKVRYHRFKELELYPRGYVYVIKPLVVGLIPSGILQKIKKIISKLRDGK